MRILIRTLSVALAVSIPITALCVGANIVTRMPDVYQYEFKSTDVLKHLDINKNDDEMGEFISDFMIGKEAEFQLVTGDEDRPQMAFNENEMAAVANARKYMNVIAILGTVALVLMVTAFIMLKKNEFDKEIRKQFKLGTVIFICLLGFYLVGIYVADKTGHSLFDVLKYVPEENDLLPKIITEGLKTRLHYSMAVISTIIMAVMGYAMHKITEPKRIFSRNYY